MTYISVLFRVLLTTPLYQAYTHNRSFCKDICSFTALLGGRLRLADELGFHGFGTCNLCIPGAVEDTKIRNGQDV